MGERLVALGRILGPHGVQGRLKVRLYGGDVSDITHAGRIFLDEQGAARKLIEARHHGRNLLLLIEGVNSPEEAKLLQGSEIFLRREDLPPLPEGEFYWDDLIGCRVALRAGRELGLVVRVFNAGGDDILEVRGDGGEYLVPLAEEFVESIDLEEQLITIIPVAGLVDDDA